MKCLCSSPINEIDSTMYKFELDDDGVIKFCTNLIHIFSNKKISS